MISWLIVAILCFLAFFIMKLVHIRHKVSLVAIIVFLLFLYLSAIIVNRDNEFDLSTTEGFTGAIRVYFGWLVNGFQNLRVITGNAVKMDWASVNDTFINKTLIKAKSL